MKVRSIRPGSVLPDGMKDTWSFSIVYNGNHVEASRESFKSASAAKQAMREHVYWLRKKHGLETN